MRKKIIFLYIIYFFIAVLAMPVWASETDGTIDSINKYAWGENIGWLNFGTTEGNVHVTDAALSGYAWGENVGWISLNCSNTSSCSTIDYKVANDSEGNLSGYAWGENIGWINFDPTGGGVTINSSGDFSGYAWGENVGWIVFLSSYKVNTDWRPLSSRDPDTQSSGGGNNFPALPVEEEPVEEAPPVEEIPPVVETPEEVPPVEEIPPVVETPSVSQPINLPPTIESEASTTQADTEQQNIEDKNWLDKINVSWKIAVPAGGLLLALFFILIRSGKLFIFLLIISSFLLTGCLPQKQSVVNNINNNNNNNSDTPAEIPEEINLFLDPIDKTEERVTKKPFGIYIDPKTSPVQPEKFSGYHTGTDFEILPGEDNQDIMISAICEGRLLQKRTATGYGGVVVQACLLDNEDITVIYGHLDLASISAKVGDTVAAGQALGLLGAGYSSDTDGERKHLHLGIHRGTDINIRGYVEGESGLDDWYDPLEIINL